VLHPRDLSGNHAVVLWPLWIPFTHDPYHPFLHCSRLLSGVSIYDPLRLSHDLIPTFFLSFLFSFDRLHVRMYLDN